MEAIKNLFWKTIELMRIPFQNQQEKKIFLSGVLLKLGSGGVLIWGQISVYIFSYFFQHQQTDFKLSLFMMMVGMLMIPSGLCMVFSVKIAQKFGYRKIIRTCSIFYPLGIFLSSFTENYIIFIFLYFGISMIAFSLMVIPTLNCLWSFFPKSSGKIAGYLFFFHGLSSCIYIILSTHIINPDNLAANMPYQEPNDQQKIQLFQEEVSKNLPFALRILSLIYSFFVIIGGFLIDFNYDSLPAGEKQINANNQINNENVIKNNNNNINNFQYQQQQAQKQLVQQDSANFPNFKTALLSRPFKIIFSTSFFIALIGIFLSINFKSYALTKINDDHFIAYTGSANLITSSISNGFWGPLADKTLFKKPFTILIILYSILTFSLPFVAEIKALFFVWSISIGILSAGVYVLVGPALIRYFGFQNGQKLMAVKSASLFIAIIFSPFFTILAQKILSYDVVIMFLGLLCLSGISLTYQLKNEYKWEQIENKSKEEQNIEIEKYGL